MKGKVKSFEIFWIIFDIRASIECSAHYFWQPFNQSNFNKKTIFISTVELCAGQANKIKRKKKSKHDQKIYHGLNSGFCWLSLKHFKKKKLKIQSIKRWQTIKCHQALGQLISTLHSFWCFFLVLFWYRLIIRD